MKESKSPLPVDIHRLVIDQQKIDLISAYHEHLLQMSSATHIVSNRKDYWSGSFDAIKTIIEILGIKDYLTQK